MIPQVKSIFDNALIRRIIKNFAYLFSATGISAGFSFFQSILTGRLLGPSAFGILGSITTFTSVINRFASFRMNELVVRYVGLYQEEGNYKKAAVVFKTAGLLEISGSILAFMLIWVLAPLGSQYFVQDLSLEIWFKIYGTIVLANLITESSNGLHQVFDKFKIVSIITTVQSSVTLAIIVFAYLTNGTLPMIIIAYMVGKFIGALLLTGSALQIARNEWGGLWYRQPLDTLIKERRSLLTFAFSTNLSSTISLISKDSEVLWVAAFLGTTQAGYYKTALAITNLLLLPISPLPKATFPELAREIARKNWNNVRYVLKQGSRLSAMYSIPTALALIIFGKQIISSTYGIEYILAYPALVLLLIGFTFVNILYWNRVALLSLARPVFPTLINFIGMVLKTLGIFLLVPIYGYLAFAGLLSSYYIFTVGIASWRVIFDIGRRMKQVDNT